MKEGGESKIETHILIDCLLALVPCHASPPLYAVAPRRLKTICECVAASTPTSAERADSRDTDSPRRQRASCMGKGGV